MPYLTLSFNCLTFFATYLAQAMSLTYYYLTTVSPCLPLQQPHSFAMLTTATTTLLPLGDHYLMLLTTALSWYYHCLLNVLPLFYHRLTTAFLFCIFLTISGAFSPIFIIVLTLSYQCHLVVVVTFDLPHHWATMLIH